MMSIIVAFCFIQAAVLIFFYALGEYYKKDIENVRSVLEKRRHIEIMLKSMQEEKAIANKVL